MLPTRPLILPLLALALMAACSTIEGAGQDLQAAGAAVSDEARETESEM